MTLKLNSRSYVTVDNRYFQRICNMSRCRQNKTDGKSEFLRISCQKGHVHPSPLIAMCRITACS